MQRPRLALASGVFVLALVGVGACGDDGGSALDSLADEPEVPTTVTPTTETTASLDEWSTAVSTLCADQAAAIDEIEDPFEGLDEVTEADLPEIATYTEQVHDLTVATIDEIAGLRLPEDAALDAGQFLEGMRTLTSHLGDLVEEAEAGDVDRFEEARSLLLDDSTQIEPLLEELDVEECAV
jgi:hypothetical protein